MSDDYRYYVDWFYYDCQSCGYDLALAGSSYTHIIPLNFNAGEQSSMMYVKECLSYIMDAIYALLSYYSGEGVFNYNCYNALKAGSDYTNGGGAVNMDSILSAMITATFEQLQKFIGIEDAYRVALWNAPFNAEFYAALARGFQKWP